MSEIPPNAATVAALPAQAQAAQEPVPEAGADFASLLASALAGGADPATGASPQETLAIQTQAAREDAGESGGGATPSATDATGAELAALSAAASLVAALITGPDAAAAAGEGNSVNPPALEPARSQGAAAAPQVAVTAAPQSADPAFGATAIAREEAAPAPATPERAAERSREPTAQPAPVTPPDPAHPRTATEPLHRSGTVETASAAPVQAPACAPPSPAAVRAPAEPGSGYAPLHPGAAGFAEAFCARVQLEIAAGRAAATIEVSPPDLGPVELRIRVADGAAHVACSAPHAVAREAIAQALPQLRDMLAAQGLALGETSVGAELPARDDSGWSGAGDGTGGGGARESASAPALAEIAVPPSPRRGLVDVFA